MVMIKYKDKSGIMENIMKASTEYGYYTPEKILLLKNDEENERYKIGYYNEKNNIVNGAEKEIHKELENKIVSKFIINKTVTRVKNEYCVFNGIVLFDLERGFEFEISSNNFLNLCMFGVVNKGEIEVECVFSFSNKGYNVLLPIESIQYQKSIEFTKKRKSVFNGELEVGSIYSLKKSKDELVYIGSYPESFEVERYGKDVGHEVYSKINGRDVYLTHRPAMKHIFLNRSLLLNHRMENYISVSASSIFENIGEIEKDELDLYISKYKNNANLFGLKKIYFEEYQNEHLGVKFYSFYEKGGHELLFCGETKSLHRDYNPSDNGSLIWMNKNKMTILNYNNVSELPEELKLFLKNTLFKYDDSKRQYTLILSCREENKFNEYFPMDQIKDIKLVLQRVFGDQIKEKHLKVNASSISDEIILNNFGLRYDRDIGLRSFSRERIRKFEDNL